MHGRNPATFFCALALAHLSWPTALFSHPELVESDITNLDMIEELSKFRSSAGHDYSYDAAFQFGGVYFGATDSSEPDSSMKHYYVPRDLYKGDQSTVPIYAPFDGTITRVSEEVWEDDVSIANKRIEITSSNDSSYIVVLFHVNLDEDYPQSLNDWPAAVWWNHHADDPSYLTDSVSAGDLLGYADMRGDRHNFDVAVLHEVSATEKYWVSLFDLMPDTLFEHYTRRGVDRTELSFTKAYRLANPISESAWSGRDENDWVPLEISIMISSMSMSEGGAVTVRWNDVGLNYTVEEMTNPLLPAWSPVAGSWPAATNAWSGGTSTSNRPTFYRVVGEE